MKASLEVIESANCQLWFAGRLLLVEKTLKDYVGNNEKTKVIIKIAKRQEGAPAREAEITEEQRKQMMLMAYRRQEELKVSTFFSYYCNHSFQRTVFNTVM